ncbi:hypothetical protein I2400191J7_18140 [Ruminococcus bicirculans (ex Wegman et al. 2014)]
MKKYGIFESRVELRKLPERLFGIVCEDTEIGNPIKIYDSEAEALAELKKYHSDITKTAGYVGSKFYDCTIYFVAECKKLNEGSNETIDNLVNGDGIETAPLEREISLSPAEFKVNGKTIKGSKFEGSYEPIYIATTPDDLQCYFKEAYPDEDIVYNIRNNEETYDEYELDEEE